MNQIVYIFYYYHIANPLPFKKVPRCQNTYRFVPGTKGRWDLGKNACSNISILMLGTFYDIPGVVGELMDIVGCLV
jgi:hypothetical protein